MSEGQSRIKMAGMIGLVAGLARAGSLALPFAAFSGPGGSISIPGYKVLNVLSFVFVAGLVVASFTAFTKQDRGTASGVMIMGAVAGGWSILNYSLVASQIKDVLATSTSISGGASTGLWLYLGSGVVGAIAAVIAFTARNTLATTAPATAPPAAPPAGASTMPPPPGVAVGRRSTSQSVTVDEFVVAMPAEAPPADAAPEAPAADSEA